MDHSRQQGFIKISTLIAIMAGFVVIGGAGATYVYAEHRDISDRITQAERLSDEGSHSDAIDLRLPTRPTELAGRFLGG